jgi:hypothetical protein
MCGEFHGTLFEKCFAVVARASRPCIGWHDLSLEIETHGRDARATMVISAFFISQCRLDSADDFSVAMDFDFARARFERRNLLCRQRRKGAA